MGFFDNIRDRLRDARDSFAGTLGNVSPLVWYAVAGVALLVIAVVLLSLLPSSVDPNVVQLTINAAATETNQFAPTLARSLTQTPPQAALTGAAPTLSIAGLRVVNQYAASARSDFERSSLAQSAVQAAGPPNTPTCGDHRTAWASTGTGEGATLELLYAELVRPRGVRVHQSYNPGYITRIEFIDTFNDPHVVFEAAPQAAGPCPGILEVPIEGLDLPGNTVRITLAGSGAEGGSTQIDAVELIGSKY